MPEDAFNKKYMRIRFKLFLIVLPLIVAPLLIGGVSSSLSVRNAITSIAQDSLQFKAEELFRYANSQWRLLVENNLESKLEYMKVAQESVKDFAAGLIRSDTELIAAIGPDGDLEFSTMPIEVSEDEQSRLAELYQKEDTAWLHLYIDDTERVGQTMAFQPFGWMFLITEEEETFYRVVRDIYRRTGLILLITVVLALILVFIFTRALLQPLGTMTDVMSNIISSGDLSKRVPLLYADEIGDLGYRFNIMTEQLEKAYRQIKRYAYKAVVAKTQERKIRNIFQKYVPLDVLDEVFSHPESLLKGDNRKLAVLFSDIRGFTSIAESLPPDRIVQSLNKYFSMMVDVIMQRDGIVDKYIGDAIMAFFGAPVRHDNDPEQAVRAGLEMLSALEEFNMQQEEQNAPQFRIGIGINYGNVTIGNIGSEKKMDYTVIGDMVNLASRLEGLTKIYRQPLLISGSAAKSVYKQLPCRLIDRVRVKGKNKDVKIYAPKLKLDPAEKKAWLLYHRALKLYYQRDFSNAAKYLLVADKLLPEDTMNKLFLERCRTHIETPPPLDWDGVETISEK